MLLVMASYKRMMRMSMLMMSDRSDMGSRIGEVSAAFQYTRVFLALLYFGPHVASRIMTIEL